MILHKYSGTASESRSGFWEAITSLKQLGHAFITYDPGEHTSVLFWHDLWYQNCSMASKYPYLYEICTNPDISLQLVVNSQGSAITFNRSLFGVIYNEWLELLYIISQLSFTHSEDKLYWRWNSKGTFTLQLAPYINF